MADKDLSPKLAALRSLEASLHRHRCAKAAQQAPQARRSDRAHARSGFWHAFFHQMPWVRRLFVFAMLTCSMVAVLIHTTLARLDRFRIVRRVRRRLASWARRPMVRMTARVVAAGVLIFALAVGALWWRLTSGPISIDLATPWLTAAIDQNLGHRYKVQISGTVIELDENRRMAVRMRDVVLRDSDGTIVARAPKAEAGFSLLTLLSGRPRVESLNLVGAELALRVETDGKVAVFAGADKRPIATSPVLASADATSSLGVATGRTHPAPSASAPGFGAGFAALLGWIDSLGTVGLDGGDLTEVGLKSGNLVVEDSRNGRRTRFENIHLSLTRPNPGELLVTLGSQKPDRPWVLVAAVKPIRSGSRIVRLEARQVAIRDLLLASRLDAGDVVADVPISASLRAEVAVDGTPVFANGRVVIGPGSVGPAEDPEGQIHIDRFEAKVDWDIRRGSIVAPFQLVSGNTRMTLIAQAEAPPVAGGTWALGLRGGSIVIGSDTQKENTLVLNRVLLRGKVDPATRRLDIEDAEVAGSDVNIAASGFVDFATADPRLVIGMAARNMSGESFKRIWPAFVNPKVRTWVLENMSGGMVERAEVATNAPLSTLRDGGPPVPDDGLSIEFVTKGPVVRLVEGLPPVHDTDIVLKVRGRRATVSMGRGVVDLPSGRKLALVDGVFDVPDTQIKHPPAQVRVRAEGPVPAAAELLAMDRLREASGAPLDPAATRGNVSAQIAVNMRLEPDAISKSLTYNIVANVSNFAVDRFVMAQKVEAPTLRITANTQGYQFKNDVRIGGMPATVEYRKARDEPDAEIKLQAVFDDAARNRFGFDTKGGLSGPIPIKLAGRFGGPADSETKFDVDLDLTQAKIDNLLPGWMKNAGRTARASFTYVSKNQVTRIEGVKIEGSGAAVAGDIELNSKGDLVAASFPAFGLSDGDKATLKAERGDDGVIKVALRGDVFDGRAFVKSVMGGSSAESKQRRAMADFDLDLKIGALAGFHGEALRAVDLKLLSRGGRFENFALAAKIGVDTPLIGDMRERASGEGKVIYFETKDAGALFRFTDIYAKMHGGEAWIAMDPPNSDPGPRDGLLNIRDFVVRGEASLDRVASSGAPGQANPGVQFTRMRVDFTRSPGRLTIREGVVRGPAIGATIQGVIDYAADEVRMRGTFVPLYGLNNAFGQIPIVGMLLSGGSNEGLVGITFEVVGTPSKPVLNVNPISALAPGVLRKFMEFPTTMQNEPISAMPSAMQ
jgi:hypothetical protein